MRTSPKRRRRPTAKVPAMFVVPAGTDCQVRRDAGAAWQDHRTRVAIVARSMLHAGTWAVVLHGDWQVRVPAEAVARLFADPSRSNP